MRTVRISFDNNKLKETYPMALRGYITPVDFFSRVQVLNTILHRRQKFRRLFRNLFIGSIIVAALTAFVLLAMILKRINTGDNSHTSTHANENGFSSRITQPLRENHDEVIAEKFIQVDIISTSLSISETSIHIHNSNYSQHGSTISLSTTPPPSYEVAITDPPPSLPPCNS
ncbi:1487_t:CDS:2 [Paraglomus occultum]|uniref:1487_t:CDS:1 n=1 Tax=Paraglomus occultum TaxID=144539 RepID=A0A9N8ZXT5_9GLOM|nr:1487_t:CDS:2 [Paraglomus occultum]